MSDEKETMTYDAAYAYVKRSKNREQIINILATSRKTPSEIVEIMDARFSLVSALLADLKSQGIIFCINEEDKTGRLYRLTKLGVQVFEELNQE